MSATSIERAPAIDLTAPDFNRRLRLSMIPALKRLALQHKAHGLKMIVGDGETEPDEYIAILDRDEEQLLREQAEYEASLKRG